MVGLVLLMRYSRTHTNGDELYLASTAVFMMEVSNQVEKRERARVIVLGTWDFARVSTWNFCFSFGKENVHLPGSKDNMFSIS